MAKPLTPEQVEALKAVPLGEMANKLRIALALSKARQSDVSEETGIAQPYLSNLVNGRYKNLHVETARKLGDYFGVPIEDLFPSREEVAS